jgi:ElaB/YqjD/DUF883 family membrane-anchored ribosome-binding protein
MEKEIESLKKDWERLAVDMSKTWKALVAYGKSEAGTRKDSMKEEMEKHLEGLRKELDVSYEKGKEAVKAIGTRVEENPWKSLFVAFGLGMLLGKLMERRSK